MNIFSKKVLYMAIASLLLSAAAATATSCASDRYLTYEDGDWDDSDKNEIYLQLSEMDTDDQDR